MRHQRAESIRVDETTSHFWIRKFANVSYVASRIGNLLFLRYEIQDATINYISPNEMCKIRSEFTVVNIRAYIISKSNPHTNDCILAFYCNSTISSLAFGSLYINGAWNISPFLLHILQYPQRKIMHWKLHSLFSLNPPNNLSHFRVIWTNYRHVRWNWKS